MYEDKLELVRKIYEHQEGDGMILTAKDCETLIMAVIPHNTVQQVKAQINLENNPEPEPPTPGATMGTMRVRLRPTPSNPWSDGISVNPILSPQEAEERRRYEEEISRLRREESERRAMGWYIPSNPRQG